MGVAEGGNDVHRQGFEGCMEVDRRLGIVLAKAEDEGVNIREGNCESG